MRITAAELNSLKTLVYAQRSIALLGAFPERDSLKDRLKQAKKAWWRALRATYSLPRGTKFAIELDGTAAGELRIKGTGGQLYVPYAGTTCQPPPAPNSGCGVSRGQLIDSLNSVFRDLGVQVVARHD
jgi:hypothetical protein